MGFHFRKHPVIQAPSDEMMLWLTDPSHPERLDELERLYLAHEQAIDLSERDPLKYGFEFPQWKLADEQLQKYNEVFVFGGNRSSKTEYGGRSVVKAALENGGAHVYCFAQDYEIGSLQIQQPAVWKYLPPELKVGKVDGASINYSEKNGFTGKRLILPNRSQIIFTTYSQFVNNPKKFEGIKVGSVDPKWANIGFWFDEYLEDGKLYETMRYRLGERNATALLTFTPIDGFTPFVAEKLKGTRVAQTVETSPLVFPNRGAKDGGEPLKVERLRIGSADEKAIVYFRMEENPWSGFENYARLNAGKSVGEKLCRFYGIPVKSMKTMFPLFSPSVNVLSSDKPNEHGMIFPDISAKGYTRYQVVDPAGNRNYYSLWAAIDKQGTIWIWDEWPDYRTYGDWADFGAGSDGQGRWVASSATNKLGFNCQKYSELFREVEGGISIYERIIDSRFAATEGSNCSDLFTDFADCSPPMYFVPSDGQHQEKGLTRLDDWFSYNPDLPIDSANRPRCFIHERCVHLVQSLLNYGAEGRRDEALKDPMDALRYLRMANNGEGILHFDEHSFKVTGDIGNAY